MPTIKSFLAVSSFAAAVLAPAPIPVAQEQTICQSEQVGCSSGPQLCATVELRIEIFEGIPIWVPVNCYQSLQ